MGEYFGLFGFGELVLVGRHALIDLSAQVAHRDGCAGGDVETLGHAVHRDCHAGVGVVHRPLGESDLLGTEDDGDFSFCDVEVVEADIVARVWGCGDDLVALGVQELVGGRGVEVRRVELVVGQPLKRAACYAVAGVEEVAVFDDGDVLNAEAVARPEDCAGVLAVEDVLEGYRHVASASGKSVAERGDTVVVDERLDDVDAFLRVECIESGQLRIGRC